MKIHLGNYEIVIGKDIKIYEYYLKGIKLLKKLLYTIDK
jgi:hypothetical protein